MKYKFRLFNYDTKELKYFTLKDLQNGNISITDDMDIMFGTDIGGNIFYDKDIVNVTFKGIEHDGLGPFEFTETKKGIVKFGRGMFVVDFGNEKKTIHELIMDNCQIEVISNFYEYNKESLV